ncbi:MAG: nucleotidyltransferase domain-containing protein [Syntrophobacteraceae bacterium]|jgi:predicted nucleotidyltransferase
MNEEDLLIAREPKRRLSELARLVNFCVCGSRARGDAEEGSDMDVFVEVETLDKNLKERIRDIAWEVGFENSLVISLLIFTRDELDNSPLRSSPIVKAITQEGIPRAPNASDFRLKAVKASSA